MGLIQKKTILDYRIKHALSRFKSRFGIFLTEKQYFDLVCLVFENKSKFIYRCSNNYSIHQLIVGKEKVPVVYSKKHKIIVTVYCNSWIKTTSKGKTYIKKANKKIKSTRDRNFEKPPYQLKNKWSKKRKTIMGIS